MKKIKYLLEAAALYILFFLFSIMPPAAASNVGGWLGRTIGPRMGASRKALKNLALALPELNEEERKNVIHDMWDNLGRVVAEYPHLEVISRERTDVEGREIIERLIADGTSAILISGHVSNWEVCIPAMLTQYNRQIDITYRAPNNPWADRLLNRARTLGGRLNAHPKARDSGRKILEAIKAKRYIGILIDQKYNEGVAVPFFGHPAMTNPIFAQLAQKYEIPLIPAQAERIGPARFRITVHPPLPLFSPDGKALPTEQIIGEAHRLLESWIRKNPGQWLWLHRRWESDALKKAA